ncbi:hypothetical protein [Pseudomonas sp. TWR3-1-1]|uniref:hypothetical protein n=1 Tax=Pseudomonas sp. TWR3-1-1 TaxID=2804633 RepID=UPI003CFAFDBC
MKKHLSPSRRRALRVFFVKNFWLCNQYSSPGGPWGFADNGPFHFVQSFAKKCKEIATTAAGLVGCFKPPKPAHIGGWPDFSKVNRSRLVCTLANDSRSLKTLEALHRVACRPFHRTLAISLIVALQPTDARVKNGQTEESRTVAASKKHGDNYWLAGLIPCVPA